MIPILIFGIVYASTSASAFLMAYTYWLRNKAEREGNTLTVSLSGWTVA